MTFVVSGSVDVSPPRCAAYSKATSTKTMNALPKKTTYSSMAMATFSIIAINACSGTPARIFKYTSNDNASVYCKIDANASEIENFASAFENSGIPNWLSIPRYDSSSTMSYKALVPESVSEYQPFTPFVPQALSPRAASQDLPSTPFVTQNLFSESFSESIPLTPFEPQTLTSEDSFVAVDPTHRANNIFIQSKDIPTLVAIETCKALLIINSKNKGSQDNKTRK